MRSLLPLVFAIVGCNGILGWEAAQLDSDTCAQYCAAMNKNCTGSNQKYITTDVCLKMCAIFEPGLPNDVTNNNQTCRLHFALAATNDPATNCEAAGPLGQGPCLPPDDAGSSKSERCKAFCQLDLGYCIGDDASPAPYTDSNSCFTVCTTDPGYAYSPGTRVSDDESHDTLNCRLYHLQAAFVDDPARVTHCPHTKQDSLTCQ